MDINSSIPNGNIENTFSNHSGFIPDIFNIICWLFFSRLSRSGLTTLVFYWSYLSIVCASYSRPFYKNLMFFRSAIDISRVDVLARLCFVLIYWKIMLFCQVISEILLLTKMPVFSFCFSKLNTHCECVHKIFLASSRFICLAIKQRFLILISVDISSDLGMMSFYFVTFLDFERIRLTVTFPMFTY